MIHDAFSGNPSIINYVMFVAVFGMLSLIYLIAGSINEAYAIAPMFMVIADAINVFTFLVGGIALAAYLGAHSCKNQVCWICACWDDGDSQIFILLWWIGVFGDC